MGQPSHVSLVDERGHRHVVDVSTADHVFLQGRIEAHQRQKEPAWCECTPAHLKLSAKTMRVSGRQFLAVYPNTGGDHDPRCLFHRTSLDGSGLKGYVQGVVQAVPASNQVRIRLRTSLSAKVASSDAPVPNPNPNPSVGSPSVVQRSMSALGLLHLLFERAGMHVHTAGRLPSWAGVATKLRRAGEGVLLGRGTTELCDQLRVITDDHISADPMSWVGHGPDKSKMRRIVIMGLVQSVSDTPTTSVRLQGQPPGVFLNLSAAQHAAAAACLRQGTQRLAIAIAQYATHDPAKRRVRYDVQELAVLPLNDWFVPVASSYEHQLADMLCAAGRDFRKPLRYDAAVDAVLPDFELLDAGGRPLPMEVYGMATDEYLARKAEKNAFYAAHYGADWWAWNASSGEAIPALPKRKG